VTKKPNREIERKFLVTDLPTSLDCYDRTRISQGYVAVFDKDELRVRERSDGSLTLTVKQGSGLSREEHEIPLSEGLYLQLWPATKGRRVFKERYRIPCEDGNHVIELDIYTEHLAGLKIAEVEFESEDEAAAFRPPPWFGREVTYNSEYKNRALAERISLAELDLG
jgi:adenylate cyclase